MYIDTHVKKSIPNEKIVFKDLPQDVSNNAILEFPKDQPGIHVKSGVIFSRIRDGDNILTPFCTGDRFVYVSGNYSHALHSTTIIDHNKCPVWHKAQEMSFTRCRRTDHATNNTERCDAFNEDSDKMLIRSPSYMMCNYYKCNMKVFDKVFQSSVLAYQWRFMKHLGLEDFAQ